MPVVLFLGIIRGEGAWRLLDGGNRFRGCGSGKGFFVFLLRSPEFMFVVHSPNIRKKILPRGSRIVPHWR